MAMGCDRSAVMANARSMRQRPMLSSLVMDCAPMACSSRASVICRELRSVAVSESGRAASAAARAELVVIGEVSEEGAAMER